MEEHLEFLKERYELAVERIAQIKEEHGLDGVWNDYFVSVAELLKKIDRYYDFVKQEGTETVELTILQEWNRELYENLLEDRYETSYVNSIYTRKLFGEEYGRLLAAVAMEMYSLVDLATKNLLEEVVIRMELFVELYGACVCAWQETGKNVAYETLHQIVYWYVSDYSDITMERQIKERPDAQKGADEKYTSDRMTALLQGLKIHPALHIPVKGILQDEDWLKGSFLWDKALAKRRREVAETLQHFTARYG